MAEQLGVSGESITGVSLSQLDANGDGVLCERELAMLQRNIVDTNGHGRLSEEELRAIHMGQAVGRLNLCTSWGNNGSEAEEEEPEAGHPASIDTVHNALREANRVKNKRAKVAKHRQQGLKKKTLLQTLPKYMYKQRSYGAWATRMKRNSSTI